MVLVCLCHCGLNHAQTARFALGCITRQRHAGASYLASRPLSRHVLNFALGNRAQQPTQSRLMSQQTCASAASIHSVSVMKFLTQSGTV